jgi:hypothetical protein
MSAYNVIGTIGIVVIAVGLVVLVRMVRGMSRGPYVPPEPRCGACGHGRSDHWKGSCRYERGDTRWGDDSYGTAWKGITTPKTCGCRTFR